MYSIQDQFTLRIRRNSETDKALRALLNKGAMPVSEVQEAAGKKMVEWLLPILAKQADNLSIQKNGNLFQAAYVNVNPVAPTPIGIEIHQAVNKAVEIFSEMPVTDLADIRWPQAPPLVESIGERFREPSWYYVMKHMVRAGRHIAIAGPPGVGKDTAVQELAAREGKILVTIGGDAGFRRRDLVGSPQIVNGRSFMDVAEYAAAVVNGWWVLLTEVNAADADALMFLNTQLAPPYIITLSGKAYAVHPEFRLFVTYNPGLVGTKPLPQSFKDRFFSVQVPWFTKVQLKAILIANGMPEDAWWADSLVEYGLSLWNASVRGQIRYQVTTRRLMDAVTLMSEGIVDNIKTAVKYAVIDAIDSQIEAKIAEQISGSVFTISL